MEGLAVIFVSRQPEAAHQLDGEERVTEIIGFQKPVRYVPAMRIRCLLKQDANIRERLPVIAASAVGAQDNPSNQS